MQLATQRATRSAIEFGERRVACNVECRELVVPAVERFQSCATMAIKSGQTAVLAINRRQPWVVVAVQASQRALASDIKRGNLVVAGEECSERIQATNGAQVGDGTIPTIQVGDGRAVPQTGNGCKIVVVVTSQVF